MNSYEAKQAARKQRLEDRAARLESEAQSTYRAASEAASAIPFGQPILVGHHSEKRDRNYRRRFNRKFEKSIELHKAAGEAAARADSIGKGGISSDDPDALDKLDARISELEGAQVQMRQTNAAWRKAGRPAPDDQEGWKKVADILARSDNDFVRMRAGMARAAGFGQGQSPFEPWALSNNSANLKRLKDRRAKLERRHAQAEQMPEIEHQVGDVRVVENIAENRLQLFFPGKPDGAIRGKLKQGGFRWSRYNGCWQAHLSANAKWRAGDILGTEL